MRPLGSMLGLLVWRLRIVRTSMVLRVRGVFSMLVVFGGVGVAVGYSVVSRFSRGLDADDETGNRRHDE